MTRLRKVAVVTTFSKAGFEQYGKRMINSFLQHWPDQVDLYVYPDEPVPLPRVHRLYERLGPIPEKEKFIEKYRGEPKFTGYLDGTVYNYKFDAIKFCHKPFALWHCMHNDLIGRDHPYDALIWLDADTLTHTDVPIKQVHKLFAPDRHAIQFLGRDFKYTECGYLYFNLRSGQARDLLEQWVGFYLSGTFRKQREWHDSWLYDQARIRFGPGFGNNLTANLQRRNGGGHPLINSPLGKYLDHLKGDGRKVTGRPRKGDLFVDHSETEYWRKNSHAKRTQPKPTQPPTRRPKAQTAAQMERPVGRGAVGPNLQGPGVKEEGGT